MSQREQFESNLGSATTETRNQASANLDELSSIDFVRLMNQEDAKVAQAVATQAEQIAQAIDVVANRLERGGRLVYFGAGTSGRLGVLDAVECRPTFNAPQGLVIGLIAGGHRALTEAVEGAEDREQLAIDDLNSVNLSANDVVCGIASSGRTPYVAAGLRHARSLGAFAMVIACNDGSAVTKEADLAIVPVVGPEILTGSTRLKAGTATKLVLNMISTGTMVRLGKTYGNLMVDLRASNEKLQDRARRIIRTITNADDEKINQMLSDCQGELKASVVCLQKKITPESARALLAKHRGRLRAALEDMSAES